MKILLADQGLMGSWVNNFGTTERVLGAEYFDNSDIDHLWGLGLWIGAIVDTGLPGNPKFATFVTQSDESDVIGRFPWFETYACDSLKPWIQRSNLIDQNAVSENDYICEYSDTMLVRGHHPLGIKVIQSSYAWAKGLRAMVLPFDFVLTNIGKRQLREVYIGFDILPSVGPVGSPSTNNYAGYWPELNTAYVQNPIDEGSTPIGFTLLSFPRSISSLKYYYQWYDAWFSPLYNYETDENKYNLLSGAAFGYQPALKPNESDTDLKWDAIIMSFGPIDTLSPGDTLRFSLAVVGGLSLRYGPQPLYGNAQMAQTLFSRNYSPPLVLPSPNLRIEQGFRKVTLRWGYEGTGVNPKDLWDDANRLAEFYPPDYWRRADPPPGHSTGGRVFEGYRLYRSEDPAGTANSFTLLKEWSVLDSIGPKYAYSTGIETTFVDTNLLPGKVYWYAVTSFGIPDRHVIDYLDWDGTVRQDTLSTASAESSVLAARKRVKLTFSASNEPDKVLVVPNPYRTDQNYTTEFGGYEGRSRSWTENDRLIKFIHLPAHCTIRIFTLAGDVVATLYHDDPVRGEMDWNLISESNRAIASGVYVFTVESDLGTQTGKFVVIR